MIAFEAHQNKFVSVRALTTAHLRNEWYERINKEEHVEKEDSGPKLGILIMLHIPGRI